MPLTAASEIVRSTDFSVSFAASVADFWAGDVVVKKRVRVNGRALRGMVRKKDIFDDTVFSLTPCSGVYDLQ